MLFLLIQLCMKNRMTVFEHKVSDFTAYLM